MTSEKAMNDVNFLLNRSGESIDDFYRVFLLPYPNDTFLDDAINDFLDLIHSYVNFMDRNFKEPPKSEKYSTESHENQLRFLALHSADVLGNLAVSIKLAGSGYIAESLTLLRSAIDICIQSLFSTLSVKAISDENWINPIGEALSSSYYHRLREISLDELAIDRIGFGEESEEKYLGKLLTKATKSSLAAYFNEMEVNSGNIDVSKMNEYTRMLRGTLSKITVDVFKKAGKQQEQEFYMNTLKETASPENLLIFLMDNSKLSYRVCKEHEDELMKRLKSKLKIKGDLNEKELAQLKKLTFQYKISDEKISSTITCDECEKPPEIWSRTVRFKKDAMIKFLKYNLDKDLQSKVNECAKAAFDRDKTEFFGDLINYKIYAELNPFSHGDAKDEPTLFEWYNKFIGPFMKIITCLYDGIVNQ